MALAADAVLFGRVTRGQALLGVSLIGQALLTACFLDFVHERASAIRGDYGLPYKLQTPGSADKPEDAELPP